MKSDKEFVNTLEDEIIKRGAPDMLISGRSPSWDLQEGHGCPSDVCHWQLAIWTTSPTPESFQNGATQTIKEYTNNIMNRTGAPAYTWLLYLMCVCLLLNHLSCPSLDGDTPPWCPNWTTSWRQCPPPVPLLWASILLWPRIGISLQDWGTTWLLGWDSWILWWPLTYKILTADTQKLIPRSLVRSAAQDHDRNVRLDTAGGGDLDTKPIVFHSRWPYI